MAARDAVRGAEPTSLLAPRTPAPRDWRPPRASSAVSVGVMGDPDAVFPPECRLGCRLLHSCTRASAPPLANYKAPCWWTGVLENKRTQTRPRTGMDAPGKRFLGTNVSSLPLSTLGKGCCARLSRIPGAEGNRALHSACSLRWMFGVGKMGARGLV